MEIKDDSRLLGDTLSDFEISLILSDDLPRGFSLGKWDSKFQKYGFLVATREIVVDCEDSIFQVGLIHEVCGEKTYNALFTTDLIGNLRYKDYIVECNDALVFRSRQLFEVTVINPDPEVRRNIFLFRYNR